MKDLLEKNMMPHFKQTTQCGYKILCMNDRGILNVNCTYLWSTFCVVCGENSALKCPKNIFHVFLFNSNAYRQRTLCPATYRKTFPATGYRPVHVAHWRVFAVLVFHSSTKIEFFFGAGVRLNDRSTKPAYPGKKGQ